MCCRLVTGRKLTGLVGEYSVPCVLNVGVDVSNLAASKLVGVNFFKRLWLGRANVLPALIEVAFWSFRGFGLVLFNILFGEERPANKVASLDGFQPSRFDWIAAHCVHPLDCLLGTR